MIAAFFEATIRSAAQLINIVRLSGLRGGEVYGAGRPTVVGVFRAASGIGSGARLLYQTLADAGLEPSLVDLTDLLARGQALVDWSPSVDPAPDDGRGPIIVHLNAPEVAYALKALGPQNLKGRLRIAYWAWELERLPRSWVYSKGYFHEIWAPSDYTAAAIRGEDVTCQVRSVGYALPASAQTFTDPQVWRDRLAPNGELIVFNAFDFRSSMERKNPVAAIEIFRRAMRGRTDAILVLKQGSLESSLTEVRRLEEIINGDPRIRLIDQVLDSGSMQSLIAAADIYLSPHRCEGFGLMLAQSLLAGKEVIMTKWSGNMDFGDLPGVHSIEFKLVPVNDPSGIYSARHGRWAEPDPEHGASLLRSVLDFSVSKRADRSEAIAAAATRHFSVTNWVDRLGDRFRACAENPFRASS